MKIRVPPLIIHVVCCLAFLVLPYVFAPDSFSRLGDLAHNQHERTNLLMYSMMLLFFYGNYYILIPLFYVKGRYVTYAGSVLLCFGVIITILLALDRRDVLRTDNRPPQGRPPEPSFSQEPPPPSGGHFPPPQGETHPPRPLGPTGPQPTLTAGKPPVGFELNMALYLFLVGLFVSLALRINSRLRESEEARLITELSYLKAQINPHFLFNTLNSIYALAIEKSDEAPDAIAKLSALMRYVLGEATRHEVPLAHDLEYIRNYIDLQQSRLGETVTIDYQISGQLAGLMIAPLILISFIENAFKYGVNPEARSVIRINIGVQRDRLKLNVWNAKVRRVMAEDSSFGIGISNTETRLKLLYPNRHELQIHDQPDSFGVELVIDL